MTSEEFNIKYEKYLEKGHYGCDLGNEKQINYLNRVFRVLTKIPGFTYSQIKNKFGGYRFYCSNVISGESCDVIETRLKTLE